MIIDREPESEILRGDWFMLVCLDGFEPQLAQIVIEVISEQSEETLRVMVELACHQARWSTNLN